MHRWKPSRRRNLRDHRHRIGHRVDASGPALRNLHPAEDRIIVLQAPLCHIQNVLHRLGVENAHRLEGRHLVQRPAPLQPCFLDKARAQPEAQPLPVQHQRGKKFAEQPERVRHDVGNRDVPVGDGVAAIEPLAESKVPAGAAARRPRVEGLGAHHRIDDAELRQRHAQIAAEAAGPCAARQHHRIAGDRSLLGDDGGNAAPLRLEPAHRTAREDLAALAPERLRHQRHGKRGLGPAIIGGIERTLPRPGAAGLQCCSLLSADHAGRKPRRLRIGLEPAGARGKLFLRLAEIEDAAAGEARLGFNARIHPVPQGQRHLDQRNLTRVPPHLPAPAPVPAGLLGGDLALLQQHHVDAAFGQFKRRRNTRHAPADDADGSLAGQVDIGLNGTDGGHGKSLSRPSRLRHPHTRGWALRYCCRRCARFTSV